MRVFLVGYIDTRQHVENVCTFRLLLFFSQSERPSWCFAHKKLRGGRLNKIKNSLRSMQERLLLFSKREKSPFPAFYTSVFFCLTAFGTHYVNEMHQMTTLLLKTMLNKCCYFFTLETLEPDAVARRKEQQQQSSNIVELFRLLLLVLRRL